MAEILFFVSAFAAEAVGTMAGFGSSTIFLPLALFFVDFKTALILVAFLHLFGNLGRITFFRHGIDQRLVILFGVPSIILTAIGASLVNYTPQETLKLILGVFLLLFAVVSLLKPNLKFSPTKTSAFIGGLISGFFAGLIGIGGVLRGSFLAAFNLKKDAYIATAALIALVVDITRLPVYFYGNFLDPGYYWYIPVLLIVAFVGSYTGKRIVNRIPQQTFRIVVFIAVALISVKFICDGIGLQF